MINSLAPGRCGCNFKCVIFEDTFKWLIEHSQCICHIWMPQDISDDNIVSSYGLVSSGNKSSPEPILFIKYDIIRTQWLMWNKAESQFHHYNQFRTSSAEFNVWNYDCQWLLLRNHWQLLLQPKFSCSILYEIFIHKVLQECHNCSPQTNSYLVTMNTISSWRYPVTWHSL